MHASILQLTQLIFYLQLYYIGHRTWLKYGDRYNTTIHCYHVLATLSVIINL